MKAIEYSTVFEGILTRMPRQNFAITLALAALILCAGGATRPPGHAEVKEAVLNLSALQPGQQAVIAVVVDIASGFHAQSREPIGLDADSVKEVRFDVQLDKGFPLKAYEPVYPAGETHQYTVGTLNVYTGQVITYVPLEIKADAKPGPLKLTGTVSYQACDANACYQPQAIPFTVETSVVAPGAHVDGQHAGLFKNFDPTTFSRVGGPAAPSPAAAPRGQLLFGRFELKHNSYVLAFIAAFLAGIIFNAVPCVLPVLPIKAIGFYEVSKHNRARSIAYGAVFSLGLIASFAALAMVVVVYRVVGWGEIYSNVWFNIGIVVVLLVMAVGTFGAFSVNLPTAVYNLTPRHDTYLGNFLFGILTAVLSTPCTFGLFLGLLVWAASQPAAIGVSLVMMVGVGMAFPYFLLSAFPELARRFPRTGPWSELVKQLMAFMLLGSAIFFARRFIVPYSGPDAFWWILFGVGVFTGLYLIGKTFTISPGARPRLAALVIAALIVGGMLIVVLHIVRQPYAWAPYSAKALDDARKGDRVVAVEFTAAWCSTCQYLDATTLHDAAVVATVKSANVEMLKADLTSSRADGWPLLKRISDEGVAAIPFTAVYGPGVNKPLQLRGIYSVTEFQAAIGKAGGKRVAMR